MGLRSFFRSRWVKIPLLLVVLLVLAAVGYVVYQLGTTTPGMYSTVGVSQPASASTRDEGSETLVYTSLRPGNWDIYLFDSLDAAPRRLTDDPTVSVNVVLPERIDITLHRLRGRRALAIKRCLLFEPHVILSSVPHRN